MSAATLLDSLNRRGVRFALDGETLRAIAGQGVITGEMKAQIAAAKPALIAVLKARAADNTSKPAVLDEGATRAGVEVLSDLPETVAVSSPAMCLTCSAALIVETKEGWRHSYCAGGNHFDQWEPIAPDHPPLSQVWGLPDARRQSWELAQRGVCPCCGDELDRQQREPLTLWCAGCRVFFDERFFCL